MRILITGASGFIGSHIRRVLEQTEHEIIPADRRHGMDFNKMLTVDDWQPLLTNVDVVINSVGIISEGRGQCFAYLHQFAPSALFRACVQSNMPRVIQISALGADDQAFTPYQLSKKAADNVLRDLPLDWFILRPSLVYGEGGTSAAMFQRLARLPVLPLVDAGRQLIQPVHISDLVATVLKCLHAETTRQTLNVVGPYPLTFAKWLGVMRKKCGKKSALIVPIPWWAAISIASVAHHLVPILNPDNLRMLKQGNTADAEPLATFLGRPPLSPEEAL